MSSDVINEIVPVRKHRHNNWEQLFLQESAPVVGGGHTTFIIYTCKSFFCSVTTAFPISNLRLVTEEALRELKDELASMGYKLIQEES
ncbi:MAG: hypothetical protein R3346_02705 [Candidatus Spechtbacterales bacterium]|nr:hypothetical protein [Candidatus Spechtbacterales bacterium]